jgi:chorismate synthase
MSSEFGKQLRISVFGQSHGPAVGAVADGFPAGESVDLDALAQFMNRRAPGRSPLSTPRKETDIPHFLSGLADGKTCGAPLCVVLENSDTHSSDYELLRDTPRPGHADFTAQAKWHGAADLRGGGHFSGRLTAPLCAVGGIALQILARRGIFIGAHLAAVGTAQDDRFPLRPSQPMFQSLAAKEFPVLNEEAGSAMRQCIEDARADGDSVGGIVECAAIGLPAGWGSPMFDGVENRLAAALFGIPAVKGVEFGSGFGGSALRGSENNDSFRAENGKIYTETNHAGGILGGITTGMPVVFQAAFKPTPSISKPQKTVRLSGMENVEMTIRGRHDPCVALRAVPAVEAVAALVLLDLLLEEDPALKNLGGDTNGTV